MVLNIHHLFFLLYTLLLYICPHIKYIMDYYNLNNINADTQMREAISKTGDSTVPQGQVPIK